MGFRVNTQDFLRGMESAEHRTKAALGLYADSASKKLEEAAKDPPFSYYPSAKEEYTEKEIALFKTLAKRKKLNRRQSTSGGPYLWRDRTGNARQTIQGGYTWRGDTCIIYVCGNMEYSVFLELCNEKRYATLWPAVNRLHPQILRGLERLLDRRA